MNILTESLLFENEILQESIELKDLYIECMNLEYTSIIHEEENVNKTFYEKILGIIERIKKFFIKIGEFIRSKFSSFTAKFLDKLNQLIKAKPVLYATHSACSDVNHICDKIEEDRLISDIEWALFKVNEIRKEENYNKELKNRITDYSAKNILENCRNAISKCQNNIKEFERSSEESKKKLERLEIEFKNDLKKYEDRKNNYNKNYFSNGRDDYDSETIERAFGKEKAAKADTPLKRYTLAYGGRTPADVIEDVHKALDNNYFKKPNGNDLKETMEQIKALQNNITKLGECLNDLNFFLNHAIAFERK